MARGYLALGLALLAGACGRIGYSPEVPEPMDASTSGGPDSPPFRSDDAGHASSAAEAGPDADASGDARQEAATGMEAGGVGPSDGSTTAEASADGGAACVGDVSMTFSAASAYWVNQSTPCGTVSFPGGDSVSMTRRGSCATDAGSASTAAIIQLAPQWVLCGDFDISLAFGLVAFPVPTSGWASASLRAFDPGTTPEDLFGPTHDGMAVERADDTSFSPPQVYKSYTTNSADTAAVHVGTTDTAGQLRITRLGTAVAGYYWASADAGADAGAWVLLNSATLPSVPWTVRIYPAGGASAADDVVEFAGLNATSAR